MALRAVLGSAGVAGLDEETALAAVLDR